MSNLIDIKFSHNQMNFIDFTISRSFGINFVSGGRRDALDKTLYGIIEKVFDVNPTCKVGVVGDIRGICIEHFGQKINYDEINDAYDCEKIFVFSKVDAPLMKKLFDLALEGIQIWCPINVRSVFLIQKKLLNMGIDRNFVYDHMVITMMLAQKLMSRLCPKCKTRFLSKFEGSKLQDYDRYFSSLGCSTENLFVKGEGCDFCHGTGFSGHVVCAETMITDPTMMKLLSEDKKEEAEEHWKIEQGGKDILDVVLSMIESGEIDPFVAEQEYDVLSMGAIINDKRITIKEILTKRSGIDY